MTRIESRFLEFDVAKADQGKGGVHRVWADWGCVDPENKDTRIGFRCFIQIRRREKSTRRVS